MTTPDQSDPRLACTIFQNVTGNLSRHCSFVPMADAVQNGDKHAIGKEAHHVPVARFRLAGQSEARDPALDDS